MTLKAPRKLHYKFSESGKILFTEAQTKRRLRLCVEALSNDKSYSTRFKDIYESQDDLERNAMREFEIAGLFTDRYFQLQQRAWGGIYNRYDKFASVEGAFFPFVRTRFNSHQPIDEGCVWIGNMNSYPLIYVANNIARWISPYSVGGFVRKEPFLPYPEARKILPRLMNRLIYPDLNVEVF